MSEESNITPDEKPKALDTSQAQETQATKNAAAKPVAVKKGGALATTLSLLTLALLVGGGYFAWTHTQSQARQLHELQSQLKQQENSIAGFTSLESSLQSFRTQSLTRQTQVETLQRQVDSQNKRLISLSSTTREDWVLAEAEYLLRLANQRILVERSAHGALALLSAADDIVRDLGYADLMPVREALSQEKMALEIAGEVDRDGMFVRLSTAADLLQSLPLVISSTRDEGVDAGSAEAPNETLNDEIQPQSPAVESDVFSTVLDSLKGAVGSFSDYIRVTHEDESAEPILTPEYHFYIRQNARLMVERAQLAMMREDQQIYRQSLQQARFWLSKFYRQNNEKQILADELAALQTLSIEQDLPSLNRSLDLLRAYNQQLHKVVPKASTAVNIDQPEEN